MDRARTTALYLTVQATAFAGWWVVLFAWPATRRRFLLPDAPDSTLMAFGLADATVVVASLFAAWGTVRGRTWARPTVFAIAGAVLYAALYCVVGWALTGGAVLAAAAMVPAAACTVAIAMRSERVA